MTSKFAKYLTTIAAITGALTFAAKSAQAQSTEEVLGALIGGTVGAVVGGELDNKGSNSEGKVIGAVVGGSLGYVVGNGLKDDDDVRRKYSSQPGEYYKRDGRAYRRYRDTQHGYVLIPVSNNDRYYYADGQRKGYKKHSKKRYDRRR